MLLFCAVPPRWRRVRRKGHRPAAHERSDRDGGEPPFRWHRGAEVNLRRPHRALRAAAPENQKNIQDYLSAYCFGDFYTRKFLPIHERELLTFSILASQGGCEGQVKAHVGGNATVGNGKEVLLAALTVCLPHIGFPRTLNALSCINEVLPEAKQ